MAGAVVNSGCVGATQSADAIAAWLKAMGKPVTRPDILKLAGERALVKSSDGKAYYYVTLETCTCKAGQYGKMCRHRKALRAVLEQKKLAQKMAEEDKKPRKKFAPDGWD